MSETLFAIGSRTMVECGMGTDQLKELKRLHTENERLRRAVSDLTLDKLILAEAAKDEGRKGNHPVDDLPA